MDDFRDVQLAAERLPYAPPRLMTIGSDDAEAKISTPTAEVTFTSLAASYVYS